MKKRSIFLFVLLALLLTSCGNSPEKAAKAWYDAMANLDGNKIMELTCVSQQENVQEYGLISSAIVLVPQLMGLDLETEGDVSGLKFTLVSTDADEKRALVHVSGEIRMAVLAFSQSMPIDETWIMVKENDQWKWCGNQ